MNIVNNTCTKSLSLLLALVFFSLPAFGTVWYVDGDASAGGDGQSWAEAFDDIQTAISAATSMYMECMAPLDQIWVKEDVYYIYSEIQVNKIVTILGGFDGSESSSSERDWQNNPTIIHGLNSTRCINIQTLCQINGFTIRNGNAGGQSGGGIYIEDGIEYCAMMDRYFSPSIVNCTIMNNVASAGGGAYVVDSDSAFRNCTFTNNSATTGGGIYHLSSSPKIEECIFTDNNSTAPGSLGGGAVAGYSRNFSTGNLIEITNSIFYQNTSGSWGGAISYNQVYPTITNCSFSENDADIAGGGFHGNSYSEAPRIRNSIFWGDTPDELDITTSSSYLEVRYSDIQGGWTGPGGNNINANPQFVTGGELHLTANTSPCIDSASNYYAPADDLGGADRPLDGDGDGTAIADMGAWEEPADLSGVDDLSGYLAVLDLHNQPNPFNPMTLIKFNLSADTFVSLRIFDVAGRLVDVLVEGEIMTAGRHTEIWAGRNSQGRAMPSGPYFYRLEAGGLTETKGMMLVR